MSINADGQEKQSEVRDIQLLQLELIHRFVEICGRENLNYYLSAGTILGAVRHKGYIPWDDDADFMMPRPDYEKFLRVAEGQLDSGVRLDTHKTNRDHLVYYSRLSSNEKSVQIVTSMKHRVEGVWIDIYPLDGMSDGAVRASLHKLRLLALCALYMYFVFEECAVMTRTNRPWYEKVLLAIGEHFPVQKVFSHDKRREAWIGRSRNILVKSRTGGSISRAAINCGKCFPGRSLRIESYMVSKI